MAKVYSFGDSFTAGLGTDRVYEESMLAGHPSWNSWDENKRNSQRSKVTQFRIENSFTKFFADTLSMSYANYAYPGCSNQYIVDSIFDHSSEFQPGDIILVGFTSSLRNPLPFFPSKLYSLPFYLAPNETRLEMQDHVPISKKLSNELYGDGFSDFFNGYSTFFLREMFDDSYYEYMNYNTIVILQKLFEFKGVRYIMFDAFDRMIKKKHKYIDSTYYWGYKKKTCVSYIDKFNDESLLEHNGRKYYPIGPLHLSKKGHKIFANELFRFYTEVYDG